MSAHLKIPMLESSCLRTCYAQLGLGPTCLVDSSLCMGKPLEGVLVHTGVGETQSRRAGQGGEKGRSTCPRQVLSQLLLAFLDGGDLDLGRLPDDASSAARLLRLILQGMPTAETLCMASAGAIGLCQVEPTLPVSMLIRILSSAACNEKCSLASQCTRAFCMFHSE